MAAEMEEIEEHRRPPIEDAASPIDWRESTSELYSVSQLVQTSNRKKYKCVRAAAGTHTHTHTHTHREREMK